MSKLKSLTTWTPSYTPSIFVCETKVTVTWPKPSPSSKNEPTQYPSGSPRNPRRKKNSHMQSGQIIIFHQPGFPGNKGISLPKPPFGVRSCEVAIIWPDASCDPKDALDSGNFAKAGHTSKAWKRVDEWCDDFWTSMSMSMMGRF